jgi:hypothetical protein
MGQWDTPGMLRQSLRWTASIVLLLFLADESLPLLEPWRGTFHQWFAAYVVAVYALAAVLTVLNAMLKGALTIAFWRVGSGDVEKGRRILDARVAARAAQRKST